MSDGMQGQPQQGHPATCTCKCNWEAKASEKKTGARDHGKRRTDVLFSNTGGQCVSLTLIRRVRHIWQPVDGFPEKTILARSESESLECQLSVDWI